MIIPLSKAPTNKIATIIQVDTGPGLKTRLLNMGFVNGAKLKVLENNGHHIVVALEGGSGRVVALSRGIAMKILVEVQN
jgi:Fe2+ transport system protein FeoA